jgi:threonine efflux protein
MAKLSMMRGNMIDYHAVASVFLIYLVGVMIPGPNFVAVTQQAVSSGRAQALVLVLGIVFVNIFWASAAILGLATLFAVLPWLASAIKLAGALYLITVGLQLLFKKPNESLGSKRALGEPRGYLGTFLRGAFVNIANPKSIAFYGSVFAAAAPQSVSIPTFVAMIAVVAIVATVWYSFVAMVFSAPPISRWFKANLVWFNRCCGAIFVTLGLKQAIAR